jgi:protein arginine kinase
MDIQPAHLQLHAGRKLAPDERDTIRADILRQRLEDLDPPVIMPDQQDDQSRDTPDPDSPPDA